MSQRQPRSDRYRHDPGRGRFVGGGPLRGGLLCGRLLCGGLLCERLPRGGLLRGGLLDGALLRGARCTRLVRRLHRGRHRPAVQPGLPGSTPSGASGSRVADTRITGMGSVNASAVGPTVLAAATGPA